MCGVSVWLGVEVQMNKIQILSFILDSTNSETGVESTMARQWIAIGLFIFGAINAIACALTVLTIFCYNKFWCTPLALLSLVLFLGWATAYSGVEVGKQFIKELDNNCPTEAGTSFAQIDDTFKTVDEIFCSQACPCDETKKPNFP